jgi:aminoglycoside phosphotransferase
MDRLTWLDGRIAAPRVLRFFDFDETVALQMTALDGLPAHHAQNMSDPGRLIELLAEGMAMIHCIPATDCPFETGIDAALKKIATQLERQTLDLATFATMTGGHDPARAFGQLLERRRHLHAGTFTHGDYCLPNVIVKDGKLQGFVDWSGAGLSDPCRDIASCAESISFNLGATWAASYRQANDDNAREQDGRGQDTREQDTRGPVTPQGERMAFFRSLDIFEKCLAPAP